MYYTSRRSILFLLGLFVGLGIRYSRYTIINHLDTWSGKDRFAYNGTFIQRSGNKRELCIVLAGYKPYLYKAVFERLHRFASPTVDICVVSAGLFSEELDTICAEHNWSYLSTRENNVCLIQNVAIKLHPHARYIYKIDEDIFLTEAFFSKMVRAYEHCKNSRYNPGVLAPLITVNGYSSCKLLELFGCVEKFEELFGPAKYAAGPQYAVENSVEAAKFLWGNGGYLPSIDEMNYILGWKPIAESPCPVRFSIGCILFERTFWEEMGFFQIDGNNGRLGGDEEQLNTFCNLFSRPIMVSENIVVGHFSFRLQRDGMQQYLSENPQLLDIQDIHH